jgi:pyruvate dehydrogenase E2 component (dihydrolipoamide acetyltransferase)
MSVKILVPTLGEAISEAVLAAWLFQPGDSVRRGDEIAELETDKATIALESPANGVLLSILVPQGETVRPGQLLALVGKPGEAPETAGQPAPGQPAAAQTPAEAPAVQAAAGPEERGQRVSPAARSMARKLGIDLQRVAPARPGDRITTEDVERYARRPGQGEPEPAGLVSRRIPFNRIQAAAAERMAESARQIPQFSVSMDAEVTGLLAAKRALAARGIQASVTAMLVQAAARVLKAHPLLNARFDGDGVLAFETVNLGVAAATPAGLVVPVIRSAEKLGLVEIARQLSALAQAAREDRLSLSQVSEGTFTLSNLGMHGVQHFVPLVNPPQSAILGVGAARQALQPTPEGGIRPVWLMNLTVSADHRVVDGEAAARFLAALRSEIEKADFMP